LAENQHLLGKPAGGGARRVDRLRGNRFDLPKPLLDAVADHLFESHAGRVRKAFGALGNDRRDRFAGTLGGLRGGFLDLYHRLNERWARFPAELGRFDLRRGDCAREVRKPLLGSADTVVERAEKR
jgi:hypothetical protein